MYPAARGFLYFIAGVFCVVGITGLFAPEVVAAQLGLAPTSIAGTSEVRGLYGGGFLGFSLTTLAGLRCQRVSAGLMLAMAFVMGGAVVGRIVSMGLDHEFQTTIGAGAIEFLAALSYWSVYKRERGSK